MLNAVSKIVKMSTYVRNIVKYSTSSRIIQEKSIFNLYISNLYYKYYYNN